MRVKKQHLVLGASTQNPTHDKVLRMWGCRGWGWQAAGTWVSVSREMVGFPAPSKKPAGA